MFKTLIQSLKKSRQLRRISKKLSHHVSSEDLIEQTMTQILNSNIDNVNIEFNQEEFIGRTLAEPVYEDRKDDFEDEETGEIITAKGIEEFRKLKNGGPVIDKEFNILRKELFPEGTVLTQEIINDIIKTEYSWVNLYQTKPSSSSTQTDTIDELIDLAYSDEYVLRVLEDYDGNRETLRNLYNKLVLTGAGQYAGGHYIAASSLVYPQTLKFLLKNYKGPDFAINDLDARNSAIFIAHRVIEYFEKGEVGEVTY
ncbi:MAG TPA: hypothetical protein ENH85_13530 [Candidatus Scalindua sp.]|nr:hypothetical protein [Candidatus Scalindua sp.]